MPEITGLRNNALPYPVYGVPYGVVFPILDADGDPVTGATGLDSEVSKNGDTYADCTNEATEIATSSGDYYLLLTAAEMTADVVAVQVKTTSTGAKTTKIVLYPRKLVALRSGTSQGGAAGYITLDASAGSRDDRWNGCLCVATIDTLVEARIITDYTGSNQQAAVTPSWNVAPDSDDTFILYLPEGMQAPTVNVSHITEQSQTARDIGASVLLSSGTGTGQLDFTSGVVKANVTQFGGSNGTFASGRPEVNVSHFGGSAGTFSGGRAEVNVSHLGGSTTPVTNLNTVYNTDFAANYNATADKWNVDLTHIGGTAITATAGILSVNTTQFAGQTITCSGGVTIPAATLASTTNITAGTITTTTNLTNAPSDSSGVTTLLTRIGDTITISGGRVNANTTHFGGTPGVFTVSGIPVVDLKYYLGTDLSTPNYIPVNVHQVATKNASAPGTVVRFQEYVGSATTYLAVDSNGYVTYNNSPTIPSVNDIWNAATRTLTAATNITSDGNTISQTQLANLDAAVSSRLSSASFVVRSNTAQSGSTSTTIKLDASASATANLYRGLTVLITGGTGAGQARTITGYNGTTKIANVDRAWITTPDNTSTFALLGTNSPSLNTTLQVSTAAASATIRTGTAQSGSTSNTIKLDTGASATNSVYVGNVVSITSGTGLGQTRTIVSYNGTTKVATVDRNWTTTPDNTSVFAIVANINPTQFSDQGVAQAATSSSITLAATASATDSIYVGSMVTILSGTAAGETSEITAYNGTTKVATVSPNFGSTPDSTSAYAVIPTTSGTGATVGDVPTATQIRIEMDTNSTQLAAILDDTGTAGVVVASGSKTGYSLASTGLDSISTTAPSGVASNFREMLVQVWRRFFKKTVYDNAGNTIKTYADDGTTIVTTQTATSAAGVETQGPAT